ncbi:alpha/beta hydrolase [Candidatus Uhrbacteria bacterium]|nr:alpha/beta hydrolase [Candidatus Uhrbacteria bacterium]
MAERITLKTVDGVTIVADWVAAPTTIGASILLHMMPANRKSWVGLQAALMSRGVASLAIDLRGHGESVEGPDGSRIDFKGFTDDEHQSSLYDVIAAFDWLRRRGFEPSHIVVCGASIGANIALQMLLEEPALAGAALLSPGSSYHGTDATFDAPSVLPPQSLWVAASEGDDQKSFEDGKAVVEKAPSDRKEFVGLKNAGHGTNMFSADPKLTERLADWIRDLVR